MIMSMILRVLCTFVSDKYFCQLLDISSKIFNSEVLYVEVWFTDQDSKPPKTEHKTNISLLLNEV